jgi:hypothetical protein
MHVSAQKHVEAMFAGEWLCTRGGWGVCLLECTLHPQLQLGWMMPCMRLLLTCTSHSVQRRGSPEWQQCPQLASHT